MKLNKKYGRLVPALILSFMIPSQYICKSIYRNHSTDKQDEIYRRIDKNLMEKQDRICREINKKFLDDMENAIERQRKIDRLPTLTRTMGTKYRIRIPDDD